MKVSYLTKVVRASLGATLPEDAQPELGNEPSGSSVQLQQPLQKRLPFSTILRVNETELGDVDEGIISEELLADTSAIAEPGTMGDQESEIGQRIESDRHGPKPTINDDREIRATPFSQDNLLPIWKKADVDLHGTIELNAGRADVTGGGKEAKQDESGLQNIEDKIDIQRLKVKTLKPKESDRIPTVEVVEQDAVRVPRSNQLSSPSSISQLVGINPPSQELNENKQVQQLKVSTSQKEKVPGSETLEKATGVPQKPTGQQNMNVGFFTESLKESENQMARNSKQKRQSPEQLQPQTRKNRIAEPQKEKMRIPSDITKQEEVHGSEAFMKVIEVVQKPTSQQNLKAHFFTEPLRKSETQMVKIAKDVALIAKKLDRHVSNEQPEPARPVLLPKRPASHNLGGWSNLERNYIR